MSDNTTPNVGETCGRCPTPKVAVYAVGGLMPAQPGWVARFAYTPDPNDEETDAHLDEEGDAQVGDPLPYHRYHHLDVLAYDPEGYAMVIDEEGGRLHRAESYGNFVALVRPEGTPNMRGYLPSVGGWQVRTTIAGEQPQVRPVVGWGITDLCDALPIVADTSGQRQAAYVVDPDDDFYTEVAHIPPTHWAPTGTPSGRGAARPASTPNAQKADAQVGETPDAQPTPTAPAKATPKKTPTGRGRATPKATPNVDELTPTLRVRLAQLGEQYPGEVPGRDAVMKHMAAQGIAGFTSKGQTDTLIRVLRADRAQFAEMTADKEEVRT